MSDPDLLLADQLDHAASQPVPHPQLLIQAAGVIRRLKATPDSFAPWGSPGWLSVWRRGAGAGKPTA